MLLATPPLLATSAEHALVMCRTVTEQIDFLQRARKVRQFATQQHCIDGCGMCQPQWSVRDGGGEQTVVVGRGVVLELEVHLGLHACIYPATW